MNYKEMIEGLLAAGHDPPPAPRRKATAASALASMSVEEFAAALNDAIERYVEPLMTENEALRERIAKLEARPQMKYCGVWNASTQYAAGDFVTQDGSVWFCHNSNKGIKPGDTRDWQLAVKKGRDAQPRGTALPRS